jgi:glycosyltransferase involved in cell wall biosynthesis
MQKQPFISVLIPTYNCAQYISEAIDSVLAQDYDNLEIIVVDDGSTDNTGEIIKRYVETRITASLRKTVKYFYKENGGISSARNTCLEKASGDYIAWLDADDYWAKGKLKAQIKYFNEHPDCEIVFTKFDNFFEDEELRNNPRLQHEIKYANGSKQHFTTVLMKKDVFEKSGNFMLTLEVGEDLEIVSRMMMQRINVNHCIEEVYYQRRLHGVNSIITMNYSAKNIIYPNLIHNLRKSITTQNNASVKKY